MALAGLWESWKAPDGSILRSVTIITTEANEVMRPIHHRMPVIISQEHWQKWLEIGNTIVLQDIRTPDEAELLQS